MAATFAAMSPRSPRMPEGKRATLSNLGAFLPRPQAAPHQGVGPACEVPLQTRPGGAAGAGDFRSPRTQQAPPRNEASAQAAASFGASFVQMGGPLGSPRLSPRTARGEDSGRPVLTLSQIGAMLPRPGQTVKPVPAGLSGLSMVSPRLSQGASAGAPMMSPRMSPRATKTHREVAVPPDTRPDTRSGVVYDYDGLDIWYGLGASESRPAEPAAQREKRDGFDKFYGIRSSGDARGERTRRSTAPPPQGSEGLPTWSAPMPDPDPAPAAPAVRSAASTAQPAPWASPASAPRSSPRPAFRVVPPAAEPVAATAPAKAQTYSMSTPSAPAPFQAMPAMPTGVQTFSVSTPSAPPPAVPRLPL